VRSQTTGTHASDAGAAARTAVAAAVVVLATVSVGPAAALFLTGVALLAWAVRRLTPDLPGPSSWAVGLLVELAVLLGVSMAFALVLHGPLSRWASVVALLAPVVVAAVIAWWSRPAAHDRPPREAGSRSPLAWVVAAVVLAGELVLSHHGRNYGIAWAMSGDSRNHAMIVRAIIDSGGLTVGELKSYPSLVNGVTAVLSVADGRSGLRPGDLMVHDARAVADTFVLAITGVATLSMAAVYQFVGPAVRRQRRLPVAVGVTLLACAGVAVTPLVLGTALNEGFLSAYGALPIALAVVVLALELCDRPSLPLLLLLGVGTGMTLFGWTMLAIVPVVASAVVAGVYLRRVLVHRRALGCYLRERWIWVLAAGFSFGLVGALMAATFVQRRVLEQQLVLPGAIVPVSQDLLVVVGLVAVGLFCVVPGTLLRVRLLVPVATVAVGIATVHWINAISHNQGPTWIYYAAKTEWIIVCAFCWVAFVPMAVYGSRVGATAGERRWQPVLGTVQALAFSAVVYAVLTTTTPLTSPVALAFRGWFQPVAPEVSVAQRIGNLGHPYVVWHYVNGGDDRLANFWSGLAWDTTATGLRHDYPVGRYSSFIEWAYLAPDAPGSLCTLARATPGLVVVTSDPSLRGAFDAACPSNGARVVVASPPPTTPPTAAA
jgi:hypothetical protein